MMAVKRNDGEIGIGWSKCSKHDLFNKEMAERIAFGRAIMWDWNESQSNTPFTLLEPLQIFRERAKKYFKIENG